MGSVLPEELAIGNTSFGKLPVILARLVKELFLPTEPDIIILGVLHREVIEPTQLTINISLFDKLCIVRHPRPLHLIFHIRISSLLLRQLLDPFAFILLETFVEEYFVVNLVLVVETSR